MGVGFKVFLEGVNIFFILYLVGYATFLFLSIVIGISVLYQKKEEERLKNTLSKDYYVPVSILVPAYNEEVTVVDTVKSLLNLDYPLYEIVVVDDGSKDDTAKRLIEHFNMYHVPRPIHKKIKCQPEEAIYETLDTCIPITLVRKKNGGKADALNMGINVSQYPYFICMDADSVLQYDSLKKIIKPILEDDQVVAVGGIVRVANGVTFEKGQVKKFSLPKKLLAAMQVIEYGRSFLAARILFDQFNGNLIISGAFGLFQKRAVIAVGGYDHKTMGEDMELVVKLHVFHRINHKPYKIKYAPDTICWTQVPEKIRDLRTQRKRWHVGLFQSMWRHRRVFGSTRYGALTFVSFVYFLLYELLAPYIEVMGMVMMCTAVVLDIVNIKFMIGFLGIYIVFNSMMSLTAFWAQTYTCDMVLSFRDLIKSIVVCLFESVFFRFILLQVKLTAFISYKKKRRDWGEIKREKIELEMNV